MINNVIIPESITPVQWTTTWYVWRHHGGYNVFRSEWLCFFTRKFIFDLENAVSIPCIQLDTDFLYLFDSKEGLSVLALISTNQSNLFHIYDLWLAKNRTRANSPPLLSARYKVKWCTEIDNLNDKSSLYLLNSRYFQVSYRYLRQLRMLHRSCSNRLWDLWDLLGQSPVRWMSIAQVS